MQPICICGLEEIKFSYAFVQTNGVRMVYRNIAELRDAVRDFVELYNAQWKTAAFQARRVKNGTGCA